MRTTLTLLVIMSPYADACADEPRREPIAAPLGQRSPWVGVSSCSAQPCHGDVKRDSVWPIWGNEVTLWIERDPHAQAYRVLSNELSKQMARRLRLEVPANRSHRCLGCHSPGEAYASQREEPVLADGVGCEACHGGAQKWLAEHTLAGWQAKSARAKRESGMVDTKNLHDRAQACAKCHVGAAGANGALGGDVDHELIAAGHPALKFEFTAYLSKMPKHWSEKVPLAGFDARAWAVGQTTSAAAALALLADRAARGNESAWPEFAEYDCYSCHHQLHGASDALPLVSRRQQAVERQSVKSAGKKPTIREQLGLPLWGNWYLPLTRVLPGTDDAALKATTEVERLMRHPGAERQQLVQTAGEAARRFDRWGQRLMEEEYSSTAIDQLLGRLKTAAPAIASGNWDGEAQLYLALVALHYAKHDRPGGPPADDRLTRSLRQTREELMFPTTVAGEERRFDSPRGLDPEAALRERLLPELERLLKE
jgi:hypothetical protein